MSDGLAKRWKEPDKPVSIRSRPVVEAQCSELGPHDGPLCVGWKTESLKFLCLGHLKEAIRKHQIPKHIAEHWIYTAVASTPRGI